MLYSLEKPEHWNTLSLNEKVKYYGTRLTKDYSDYVDKLKAKDIVKSILGSAINIPRTVRVLDHNLDIYESDLNPYTIIKGAHGCKFNINIVRGLRLPRVKYLLQKYSTTFNPHQHEIQYTYLQPRFFIEEKVDDYYTGRSGEAVVYMFRCIYGNPVMISIGYKEWCNYYYIDWSVIKEEIPFQIDIIPEMETMKLLASKLSNPFEFVRIDFYLDRQKQIYFSEYTFTPNAGYPCVSREIEYELGKSWI